MNIGSKVRLLHGKEEGVITKIKGGKFLEIDLGDGFSIPVLASEVVLISPMEARLESPGREGAGGSSSSGKHLFAPPVPFVEKGIFSAFVPINDREIILHLINLTGWQLLFTVFGRSENANKGLASGILESGKSTIITKLLLKEFETWPVFETNLLYYSADRSPAELDRRHTLKCRIQSFHKNLQKAPLLNVNAHLFQIDEGANSQDKVNISSESIREKMLEKSNPSIEKPTYKKRIEAQIDLHIGALGEAAAKMSSGEILAFQLKTFKTYLESSIADGHEEVTIIHGVGQGTLKQEIHRLLSKHPNVAYFREAQKEKFGYGATIAQLK
jgi:DNA-nicking Smr family endonuclease